MDKAGQEAIQEFLKLGQLGLELGQWEQAEHYFDRVLEQNPRHVEALLGKVRACQDPQERFSLLDRLLRQDPSHDEARRLYVRARRELSRRAATSRLSDDSRQATDRSSPPASIPSDAASGAFSGMPSASTTRGLATQSKPLRIAMGLVGGIAVLIFLVFFLRPLFAWVGRRTDVTVSGSTPLASTAISGPSTTVSASGSSSLTRAQEATVLLVFPWPEHNQAQRGSGCIVDAGGLILTNDHVLVGDDGNLVNATGTAFVGFSQDVRKPPSEWYIAAVVSEDPSRDLAVLRIVYDLSGRSTLGQRFPEMPIGDADRLEMGQAVIGLGYPSLGGNTLTLTKGSMAGFAEGLDETQLGKTDSELLPGSSGGAVLDEEGRLVGIITATKADQRTQGRLSYFTLYPEAQSLIEEARNAPRPHPDIGWMRSAFSHYVY